MLKWPCIPLWMHASVMKLYIPSALIELGIDWVLQTQALAVNLDYGFCDIVNDLRFLWMFRINRLVQMCVCVCWGGVVCAILNSCSFLFRHHILHTKQIFRSVYGFCVRFFRRQVIRGLRVRLSLCVSAQKGNYVHFLSWCLKAGDIVTVCFHFSPNNIPPS